MRCVSVFGLGYVGSVTVACLSKFGHRVIGLDVNADKLKMLNSGRSPIVEEGVEDLVREGHRMGLISASEDIKAALIESEVSLVSVATPSLPNGKLNLNSVQHVCRQIGEGLRSKNSFHTIVMRSTVLPGTCEEVVIPELERASGKRVDQDFAVCMNPELLREGSAVFDFFNPPLTVVGTRSPEQGRVLHDLYSFAAAPIYDTSLRVAEMVKYVSNSYHAVKVAFANEVGTMCRRLDVDPFAVTEIFLADTKLNISPAYLKPGFAFGGSCLPKDLRALTYKAKELDLSLPLFESLLPSNFAHIERAIAEVLESGSNKVGVVGLSFKSGTDDLRESPSVQLIKRLIGEGCQVSIWDPGVSLGRVIGSNRQFIDTLIPHIGSLLSDDLEQVIAKSDVVVLATGAISAAELHRYLRDDQTFINLLRLERETAKHYAEAART